MCPVCKTIRYLNKDMEFLINPECYHQMCSNCVNRLFNDGPNQCPYAGCHKTLRRKGFRSAFFGDLAVEREVDIRRRVAAVFNQAEDDFETLRDYNDYLQMVEDLTFGLVNGSEAQRREAEATLQQWEAEHKADIERNRRAGREADEMTKRRLAAERDAARQKRLEALREDEEEKRRRAREREEELNIMARAPDGAAARVVLKRRGQNRTAELLREAEAAGGVGPGAAGRLSIRGLKEKKKTPVYEGPYDPFGGLDLAPSRYTLQESYKNDWLDGARHQTSHVAGGYSLPEYTTRAMFEAFSGLGVFIDDEKETGPGTSAAEVATLGASMAAETGQVASTRMQLDDVFA
jgi:CDK-activating kinase assembly factor MAT1